MAQPETFEPAPVEITNTLMLLINDVAVELGVEEYVNATLQDRTNEPLTPLVTQTFAFPRCKGPHIQSRNDELVRPIPLNIRSN